MLTREVAGSQANVTVHRKPSNVYKSIEQDESLSLPARPKSHYASAKSTRFTSPPARQPLAETKDTPNRQPPQQVRKNTIDSVNPPAAGTYESFALPDMPNMTELLTDARADATPNASRSAKAKSRLATPLSQRKLYTSKSSHHDLKDVPVPADAKALYLSLQLLQEKVQNLEKERDQAVEKADNYELELLQLRSKVEDQKTSDQGKNWENERIKFEQLVKSLQMRLKQTSRKDSTFEATIKALEEQEVELRAKIGRREKAIVELSSMAKQLWEVRRTLATTKSHGRRPTIGAAPTDAQSTGIAQDSSTQTKARQTLNVRKRRSNLDDSITVEQPLKQTIYHSVTEQPHTETQWNVDALERCETYLSFMDGNEVAKLRQVLEEDRARLVAGEITGTAALPRKSSLKDVTKPSTKKHQQVQYEDLSEENCQEITADVSRPVSRASARSRHSQRIRNDDPLTQELEFEPEATKDMTQQSMRSAKFVHRRRKSAPDHGFHDDNMTSAYILPDITITGAALATTVQPKTANLTQEDRSRNAVVKEKATLPRAVPVSERPVSPSLSNPDPTIRPGREPGVALSLVIHSLEAEIDRLRAQLAKFEDLYNSVDPALSKRRRKAVWARICKTGEAVERRADQVYALYDVLEGLKSHGIEMKEDEVEITLSLLGLDADYLEKVRRTAEGADDEDTDMEIEGEDGEGEEDVWEGFGDTATGRDVAAK